MIGSAAFGAYWLATHPPPAFQRIPVVGLGAAALVCFVLATLFPVFLGAHPSFGRPSTTGRLTFVSPQPNEVFRGDPALIPIELLLAGASVVPISTLRLVPNEGHIHLYLDGTLVSMTTGLAAEIRVSPGSTARHRRGVRA